jgi:hypothetical protein
MGIPAVEAHQRCTTCAVACPAPTNGGLVPDRSSWMSGSYAPPWSEKCTSFLKAIEKARLQGEKGDNNGVGRHRHSHAPGIQQEPPLIVRQVSSHAASAGCSLPASRSPRSPVREGQPQRMPAHPSALSSPTAQSGMVFAPSASRRQRSTSKTPCVAGGERSQEEGRVCMGTAQTLEHLSAREPDSGLVRVVVDTPKGGAHPLIL